MTWCSQRLLSLGIIKWTSPLLEADPEVTSRLTQEEIDEIFNPTYYTKRVDEIFKRVGLD